MKARTLIFWALTLCPLFSTASDEVLFSVNGKAVTTDEFSRYCVISVHLRTQSSGESFRATTRVAPTSSIDDYISFRLKVEDATCLGLDTLPEFRQQLEILKGQVMRSYMLREQQSQTDMSVGPVDNRSVKLSIATIPLLQSATKRMEYDALSRMDSIYNFVVGNTDGWDNLHEWASDGVEVSTGVIKPYAGLLKEFLVQISMIGEGQTSRPFVSPFGVHIIRREEIRETREELRATTRVAPTGDVRLEDAGGRSQASGESLRAQASGAPTLEERLQEIHDGLLAVYWEEWRFGSGSSFEKVNPNALSAYYESHKKDYLWDLPHYKGAVIHCSDKKYASNIKKALKKLPVEVWGERLEELKKDNPEWKAEMESGLFRIGENAYIDKNVFKCGKLPTQKGNSYFFVMGRKLVKGPDSYLDVLSQVRKDYQNWRKNEIMRELRARYKVEINQDVLKTVNSYSTN